VSETRVYPDGDLAALAWSRGLLDEPPAPLASDEPGAGWRGRLAARWESEGTLARDVVKGLLDVLARAGRPCECGWILSLLPAPEARSVPCPRCGAAHEFAADPEGIPQLPGWAPRPPGRSTLRVKAPEPRSGPGSTLRTHPEGAGSGRPGARSDPSYSERGRRDRGPRATRRDPGATTRDSQGGSSGGSRLRLGPGDRVGPYVVVEELSRGAMGIVLRAYPEGLPEQRVALKVLQARVSDEEGRARFQREGEAMARLSHPAVVKVHRLGFLPNGNPYLAMELVEGQDLEQSVGEEPVEVAEAARLVAGVAQGVAHLHSRGLIHRDLKLANVLLREGREPVVADFGLVHFLDRQTRLTQVGDLIGTPLYMSPELVRGEVGVTPAADVYALGVMLYRLVAGRYPHEAPTTEQLLGAILDEEPVLDPGWPAPLRGVLGKALAYEPGERYHDAGALAADVLALHEGREVSVRPPGLRRKLARLRRGLAKRPGLVKFVGILAVSAPLVASGLFAYQWRAEGRAREEAQALTQRARALLGELEAGREGAQNWEPLRARLELLREGIDPESELARGLVDVERKVDQSVARATVLEARAKGQDSAALAERAAALPLPADPALPQAAAFCAARLELRLRGGDLEGALQDRAALGNVAGEGAEVARLRNLYQALERAQGKTPTAPDALTAARWALDRARLQEPGASRAVVLTEARDLLSAAGVGPQAIEAADPPARPLPTLHQDVGRSLKLPPPVEEVPPLDPLVAERALLALRAKALGLTPTDRGARSVVLERLRRLRRDPRRPLPPRVLARSLLLEARLASELGWTSGAVASWRRARRTWVEVPGAFELTPAPALGVRPGALLPFDLAARVGEVRAASEGLEAAPLLRAADALQREAEGQAFEPWREEAQALLAKPGARPQTPAGESRSQLDEAAASASPQRGQASRSARRQLCLGEAEVAGAGRALWFKRDREVEPRLARAEAHLRRALEGGLPASLTGRAWAARSMLALRRVLLSGIEGPALEEARRALARAKAHAATSWEVLWTEAALEGLSASLGQERARKEAPAALFLHAAEEAGASDPSRIVAVGRRFAVLIDGLLILRDGAPSARVELTRALIVLAREVRLQFDEEAAWLGVLARELRAADREPEAKQVDEERSVALKAHKSYATRYAKILAYQERRPDGGTEAEKIENWALVKEFPFAAGPLFHDYQRHRPLTLYADDSLGVAFAVQPLDVLRRLCANICYATITRKSAHLGAPVSATRSLRRLSEFGPPNPLGLEIAPPPALLRGLLHFQIMSLGDEMNPALRGQALRALDDALWESPRSQSVALLEAWIRAGVGDAHGAREALARARWLAPVCRAPRYVFEEAVVTHFIRARSFAVEGNYERAVQALRPIRGKLSLTSEWLYWERDFRIQRERWASFPPALIPVYNSLLGEEADRRR
jgi:protein kinase-like protein